MYNRYIRNDNGTYTRMPEEEPHTRRPSRNRRRPALLLRPAVLRPRRQSRNGRRGRTDRLQARPPTG